MTIFVLYGVFDRIISPRFLHPSFRVIIMAFDFSCPVCKHTMQMDNSALGEMGDCPKCGAEVSIQRSPVGSETEDPQMDNEAQLQTSLASVEPEVESNISTTFTSRIVANILIICVICLPIFFMFNGFSVFGYSYEGWLAQYEANVAEESRELSDHQKKLLEDTKLNKGPPDYSHLAVKLPEPTEEDIRFRESMNDDESDLGGSESLSGGGDNGGEGLGGRRFDPEAIFDERDKNMDGLLSGEEISERMLSRIAEMDEDEDGAISKEEFLAAMQRFRSSRQGERGEGDTPRGEDEAGRPE
jgi:hypothetical protein